MLVRATPANAARIEQALRDFGFGSLGLSAADFTQAYAAIQLGLEPNRVEAWEQQVPAVLDGVPVCFIGREHLIRNKRASGRPQDLADLSRLEGE